MQMTIISHTINAKDQDKYFEMMVVVGMKLS